jgi:hypothetical protein
VNYKGEPYDFVLPPIVGIGFNLWSDQRDFAFTNIAMATDEVAIKDWNAEDFAIRQSGQIAKMKVNYNWVTADLPEDFPHGGFFGYFDYGRRCLMRRWMRVENKPAVIVVSAGLLIVLLPMVLLCFQLFDVDPFSKMKQD